MGDMQKFAVLEIREGYTWVEDSQEVAERTDSDAVSRVHRNQPNQDTRRYAVYCYETAHLTKFLCTHQVSITVTRIQPNAAP